MDKNKLVKYVKYSAIICLLILTAIIGFKFLNSRTEVQHGKEINISTDDYTEPFETIENVELPLQGLVIGVDPGHGSYDPGFFTEGVRESDIVLDISLKLRRLLEQGGAEVVMTRETDELMVENDNGTQREELRKRSKLFLNQDVDLYVSIHGNTVASPIWRGAQTFFYPEETEEAEENDNKCKNFNLAICIQDELQRVLANTDRPVRIGNYYILRELSKPGVLVEVGFLSNPHERKLLQDEEYQELIAWSIYLGIIKYHHTDM